MKTHGGFYVSRVHQLCGRAFEKLLKESGVEAFNGAQGRILYVLWEYGQLSMVNISENTSLAKTTLTSMIDRMEESGLVTRTYDTQDRRQILVSITKKAQKYRDRYNEISDQMNAILYNGFREKEITTLEKWLARIIRNLEAQ